MTYLHNIDGCLEETIGAQGLSRAGLSDRLHALEPKLAELRENVLYMSEVVLERLRMGLDALEQKDDDLAWEVIEGDDEVNEMYLDLEKQCIDLLALQQPVASDLRFVAASFKILTDLERIGDHCRNLARNTHYLAPLSNPLRETPIPEMADLSRTMLRDVQHAFLEKDRVLARKVIARDMRVNRLHRRAFETLVELAESPEYVEASAHLITAIKALERIADHVKNIANHVIFLVEGVDIRHPELSEAEKN